ncbi:MAG: hypothetical protein IJE96_06215 [Mailhella sp.]|nr:hypothetical protein [Mailhella sp.]
MKKQFVIALLLSLSLLGGCAVNAQKGVLDSSGESMLKLRQIQTRYFDTSDKKKTVEAVIATLQDLGFVLDKASLELGSVTATKLAGYRLRMTVNVIPRGAEQMTVRASAQYNIVPVEDPTPYQHFFDALAKSLFLQAHTEE